MILFVFATFNDAHRAGFFNGGKHFADPTLRAWWPGRAPETLQGSQFSRIIVMDRHIVLTRRDEEHLRAQLRIAPMTWVTLHQ